MLSKNEGGGVFRNENSYDWPFPFFVKTSHLNLLVLMYSKAYFYAAAIFFKREIFLGRETGKIISFFCCRDC